MAVADDRHGPEDVRRAKCGESGQVMGVPGVGLDAL